MLRDAARAASRILCAITFIVVVERERRIFFLGCHVASFGMRRRLERNETNKEDGSNARNRERGKRDCRCVIIDFNGIEANAVSVEREGKKEEGGDDDLDDEYAQNPHRSPLVS